ncbi:MAG: hypothetical protein OXQ32_09670 [bacterium]|nr:hypothetical protein [bacterium]
MVVVVETAAEVEVVVAGGTVVDVLWEVVTGAAVVVDSPGVVVVAGRVVATALGGAVVDGAALVEDVVRTGSGTVVAASTSVVADDRGATAVDSGEVEESPSTPAPDVHAAANNSKSPHRSPGRLRLGICGLRGVQRHGTVS